MTAAQLLYLAIGFSAMRPYPDPTIPNPNLFWYFGLKEPLQARYLVITPLVITLLPLLVLRPQGAAVGLGEGANPITLTPTLTPALTPTLTLTLTLTLP